MYDGYSCRIVYNRRDLLQLLLFDPRLFSSEQITAALEQDEQARKQRLASKVVQLIAAMSSES